MKPEVQRILFMGIISLLLVIIIGLSYQLAKTKQLGTIRSLDHDQSYRILQVFSKVLDHVESHYVDETNNEELIESALNGMLLSLDPYSAYLDETLLQDITTQTRGSFGGVGMEVGLRDGFVEVVTPLDDTPAKRAGLRAQDLITHIDGEPTQGKTLIESVRKIRGEIGTPVTLRILRKGQEPFDADIIRGVIKIQSVRSRLEETDIGYIRISSFTEQTKDEMEKAIRTLEAQGATGYILDLRNNPGGLLQQAVAVSDAFLPHGEIVSTRGRHSNVIQRYSASSREYIQNKPLIVLINKGSASASEIVAGALQDHRRALILGTPSFGKGSVQTLIDITGNTAIKLTTARYYTPSGQFIHEQGIEPDITVPLPPEPPEEAGSEPKDAQLKYALALLNGIKKNGPTAAK